MHMREMITELSDLVEIEGLGRRYIELKLSIPMAEIISTVMTCKYNRGTNYHTSL